MKLFIDGEFFVAFLPVMRSEKIKNRRTKNNWLESERDCTLDRRHQDESNRSALPSPSCLGLPPVLTPPTGHFPSCPFPNPVPSTRTPLAPLPSPRRRRRSDPIRLCLCWWVILPIDILVLWSYTVLLLSNQIQGSNFYPLPYTLQSYS